MQDEQIFTVSELNSFVSTLLEKSFIKISVTGEISNFVASSAGHWYFSIKDENAQVRCVMFRAQTYRMNCVPKNGMQILLTVKPTLYQARGDFQLIVEELTEVGFGVLEKQFLLLKEKLEKEGLFAEKYKKNIPFLPKQIGIITSLGAAALKDVITVLKRRFFSVSIIIYPTLVQGALAAEQIVSAIKVANCRLECDVILLVRGGGSIEDLWSFNKEIVARAIFTSKIPIVTGIGHETDFTIADFVADLRAPTPSAAAELVTKNVNEIIFKLENYFKRINYIIHDIYEKKRQEFLWIKQNLIKAAPAYKIAQYTQKFAYLFNKLSQAEQNIFLHTQNKLQMLATQLHTLSPLATLKRGYAILFNKNGEIVTSIKQVNIADAVVAYLQDGQVDCEIKKIKK